MFQPKSWVVTFSIPGKGDTVRSHVDELIRRWQTDGPGKVGEDHRRLELQDDDGVPLDGRLDHPDDPTLLFPRGAAVETNGGEPGHPL